MIWKMMLNFVPISRLRVFRREAKAFRPITDARVFESAKISGLSAMFRLFILTLRNLNKVLVNSHASPASPIELQCAKYSEAIMWTLGGITID
jgi:hypothetical protein